MGSDWPHSATHNLDGVHGDYRVDLRRHCAGGDETQPGFGEGRAVNTCRVSLACCYSITWRDDEDLVFAEPACSQRE